MPLHSLPKFPLWQIGTCILFSGVPPYLHEWKANDTRKPLIVKGARQIGKTSSIMQFATTHYENVVAINFVLEQKFKRIFDDGYDVDSIIKNITLIDQSLKFEAGKTLLFFDEMQDCPKCATCLKSFCMDRQIGRAH